MTITSYFELLEMAGIDAHTDYKLTLIGRPQTHPNREKMTCHSIEKLSFCLYLRAIHDLWSMSSDACTASPALHIIRRQGISNYSPAPRGCIAHRNRISRAHFRSLSESQLSRMVGILHGQRLRSASRARVQRDSQRVRAD